MTKAARRRGKEAERQVARRLGGQRTKVMGEKAPDIEAAWFAAEVKDYQKAPEVPYRELRQLRMMIPSQKIALFVYKRPQWKDYVVCTLLSDFELWWGFPKIKRRSIAHQPPFIACGEG